MCGSHGVCDCDILRRANVKADLYLLRGGGVRPNPPNPPWVRACSKASVVAISCIIKKSTVERTDSCRAIGFADPQTGGLCMTNGS